MGEWGVDEVFEKFYIERGFLIIVVGIDNGGDKRIDEYVFWVNEEYGRGGEGDVMVCFIVEMLKFYIDFYYCIVFNEMGIMGFFFGGLMVVYVGFVYLEVFCYVGVMSLVFWFNFEIYDFVRNVEKGFEKIYIDWGIMEGSDLGVFFRSNEEMVSILKEKGYVEGVNFKVVIDEGV